jgi:death-on-curing protein
MIETPEWVNPDVVLAVHEAQLAEHGGLPGVRDQGMLESALARPQNVFAYCPESSLYELAAAYAFGFAKNHGFVDGNKRTAWVVCALFLELNGLQVIAEQDSVVRVMLRVADGSMSENQMASWLRTATKPENPYP